MQPTPERRSNRDRSDATRAALIDAARALFVEKGFAETGTPEIVAAAGVTRGALYHHFADKAALFRAVIDREATAVATRIERETTGETSPVEALMTGAEAYFAAMSEPGRTRLLLLDGPAVLGPEAMNEIDRDTGARELREGLANAMEHGVLKPVPLDAATALLSAAFDRAALAIASGEPAGEYKAAIRALIVGLVEPG